MGQNNQAYFIEADFDVVVGPSGCLEEKEEKREKENLQRIFVS